MIVSYLLCNSHFFEAILVFSKNLNSFSLPIFVLNRYSIDFWSLSNPSNASTLSARYSEHSSTKWVGFWMISRKRYVIITHKISLAAVNIDNQRDTINNILTQNKILYPELKITRVT